jgi:hypothetical protein
VTGVGCAHPCEIGFADLGAGCAVAVEVGFADLGAGRAVPALGEVVA